MVFSAQDLATGNASRCDMRRKDNSVSLTKSLLCNSSVMISHHTTTTQTAYSVTPVAWYITIPLQHKQLTLSLQCHDISPYHYNTNSLLCHSSVMIYHHTTTTQTAYSVTPVSWYITIPLQHKQLTLSLQCHDISPYHYNTNSLLGHSSVMISHHTTTTNKQKRFATMCLYIFGFLIRIISSCCQYINMQIVQLLAATPDNPIRIHLSTIDF